MVNGIYKTRNLEGGMGGGGMSLGQYSQMTGGVEQSLIGGYQFIKSEQDRKKYEKLNAPAYSENAAMTQSRIRAEQMAKAGFTPVQRAAFFQNIARLDNSRYQKATQVGGGNLAQTVNAGINYGNIGALNNFAGQDAQLQRQNIQYADSFAKNLQLIQNMNTQKDYARYVDLGKNISRERDAALQNIVGGTQTFAGGTNGLYGASDKGGGQQQQQNPESQSWQNSYGGGYSPYGQQQDGTWGDQYQNNQNPYGQNFG